jgi:hypothetical protein
MILPATLQKHRSSVIKGFYLIRFYGKDSINKILLKWTPLGRALGPRLGRAVDASWALLGAYLGLT